jgi:alkanesulfonate monooxygenase SsuD/methylene tetrahydromethanopterin reductase-like flavin-dependent oxidoreductase (luciferase family)
MMPARARPVQRGALLSCRGGRRARAAGPHSTHVHSEEQRVKFSCHVQTRIADYRIAKDLEDLGYDAIWFPDTQMMWSDCYATMALAAQCTSKIRIGTGVAITGTRIAPTTAAAIASINVLAPGRTFLGIGTGHTAMRVMGQDPMRVKEFREYLRVVRTMLRGEKVDYTYNGETREIAWQNHGAGFRNTWDEIPIYVAANGPLALRACGAYGDGLISIFADQPETLAISLEEVRNGAARQGRTLPPDFHAVSLSNVVVLRPGESLQSERVIEAAGHWVACGIHFVYEVWQHNRDDAVIPGYMLNIWDRYLDRIKRMPLPPEKAHQQLHEGHCSYYPAVERELITPEMIKGTCMVGEPAEIADQIRAAEAAGLRELSLLPPLAHLRHGAREFMQKVYPLL